jgi:hypothetical protein
VVDLNGDGRLDIVAGRAIVPTAGLEGVCSILNLGGGSWTAPVCLSTTNNMRAVATADINGDGKQDVIGTSSVSNRVTTLLGTGTGTFTTETVYGPLTNIPVGPPSLADLDGDGDKDLVVQLVNPGGSAYMAIFLNNGGGVFAAPSYLSSTATGGAPIPPQLYDYNKDGRPDIIGGNNFPEMSLSTPGFRYQPYSSTANFDCSANQSIAMTLTANLGAWTVSQAPAGKVCTLTFIQDAIGTRTIGTPPVCTSTQTNGGSCVVWQPTVYLVGAVRAAPVLTVATPLAVDVFVLQSFALSPPSAGSIAPGIGTGQGTEWMEINRCMNCTHP